MGGRCASSGFGAVAWLEPRSLAAATASVRRAAPACGACASRLQSCRRVRLFAFARCRALLFHLLHPFDRALVGAREHRLRPCRAWCPSAVVPTSSSRRSDFADIAQPELLPDPRRRFRNDRVHQRSHDAQRFRRGVENRRQARSRVLSPLLRQRPGLVLDDVLVDRRNQAPRCFKRAGKLELLELRIELAEWSVRPARQSLRSPAVRALRSRRDKEPRLRSSA